MLNPSVVIGSIAASLFALGAGYLLGSDVRPAPTELGMARELGGDNVRLLGTGCRDSDGHGTFTVLLREEDFGGAVCKEIRRLEDEQSPVAR